MVAGLPYAIFFNAIVLTPIALLCIYGLTKAIGGRLLCLFGLLRSGSSCRSLAIPYFYVNYHRRYVGLTLPSALGLTDLGDFPSMVFLLVAAYFAFRAISDRNTLDALTSGLAVGLASPSSLRTRSSCRRPRSRWPNSRQLRGSLAFAAGLRAVARLSFALEVPWARLPAALSRQSRHSQPGSAPCHRLP